MQVRGQTYALELQLLVASACSIETNGLALKPRMNLTVYSWPLHEASTGTWYCESVRVEGRQERLRLLNADNKTRPPDGGLVLSMMLSAAYC